MPTHTDPKPQPETVPCRVHAVRRLTPASVVVTLNPTCALDRFRHRPGQRITFCFPLGNRTAFRSYNLINVPGMLPQVAVKRVRRGGLSEHFNERLAVGDTLHVVPPEGHLYPENMDASAHHIMLFAAGSGITPLYSIAQHALRARRDHHVTLFYANSSARHIMFQRELDVLAASSRMDVYHILGDGGTGEDESSGRLTAGRVERLMQQYAQSTLAEHVFISGPQGFMDSVTEGIDQVDRHIPWTPYSFGTQPHVHPSDSDAQRAVSTLRISRDGDVREIAEVSQHLTLLEAADQAGVDMPAECRSGICHRCKAKLVSGRTVSAPTGTRSKPLEAGYILCCQERPASPDIEIDFS